MWISFATVTVEVPGLPGLIHTQVASLYFPTQVRTRSSEFSLRLLSNVGVTIKRSRRGRVSGCHVSSQHRVGPYFTASQEYEKARLVSDTVS